MSAILGGFLERAASEALGFGVGTALSRALEPEAATLAQEAFRLDPSLALPAETAAELVAHGRLDEAAGAHEAAAQGFDAGQFARIVDAVENAPDLGSLLELARRQTLDTDGLVRGLKQSGLRAEWVEPVAALVRVLLSPADLAMARQQGFIDRAEQHARAQLQGQAAEDAELMYELAGLPPGIGEGMELLRRGLIDEQRFAQYVREGHTKTKYTDDLLRLRTVPLSPALAVEALVRERISEADARRLAALTGVEGETFDVWFHTLGRPIAVGEALTLVNRGQMTHAQFREVVARSDVRTEYTDQLLELRVKYPPLFQVQRALANGTVSAEVAAATLHKEGYPPEWVDAVVNAGKAGKTAKHKELSLSVIETLYEAGVSSHEVAERRLVALGYDKADADDLLNLLDDRRIVNEITRAIVLLRNMYVNHRVSRTVASDQLFELLSDAADRDRLLTLWDQEWKANVKVLTPAQVGQAYKYGHFTREQAVDRWVSLGYAPEDASTLAAIVEHGKGPVALPAAV